MTTKTGHTPGPWKAEAGYVKHGANLIADCYGENSDQDANARLIAEAPAMLDELKRGLWALMACKAETITEDERRRVVGALTAILARIEGGAK